MTMLGLAQASVGLTFVVLPHHIYTYGPYFACPNPYLSPIPFRPGDLVDSIVVAGYRLSRTGRNYIRTTLALRHHASLEKIALQLSSPLNLLFSSSSNESKRIRWNVLGYVIGIGDALS